VPRGRMRENRARAASWEPSGSGAGGVPIAEPGQVAAKVAQALARRFAGLQWRAGRLTAPLWRKRPPHAEYERLRLEALKAQAEDRRGGAWDDFRATFAPSKSELLQLAGKAWGLSYATLHRLVHGTCSGVSWRTLRALRARLTDSEWRELEPAIFNRAALEFFAYVRSECDHLRQGRDFSDDYRFTRPVRAEVAAFARLCRDWGMPPGREELARLRVFDPLLAHRALRRQRLLSHTDLLRIVRQGYRRERSLLSAERQLLMGSRRTRASERRQ
jgi:hypothetical protein